MKMWLTVANCKLKPEFRFSFFFWKHAKGMITEYSVEFL